MIGTFSRLIRRFRRDQSGVSAVEFALIAPVLIIFYFGLAELTQAIMAQRRTISTASAIGDLVAQSNGATTSTAISDAMSMANIIMYPFPTTPVLFNQLHQRRIELHLAERRLKV